MTQKHIFTAGKYFVGDPCYVISDKNWDELIKNTGCFGINQNMNTTNWYDGVFYYDGKKCFASGTAYGDGMFEDNKKNIYRVDAGLIGIVPIEAINEDNPSWLGHFINFKKNFIVYENNGKFYFGETTIDTGQKESETNNWETASKISLDIEKNLAKLGDWFNSKKKENIEDNNLNCFWKLYWELLQNWGDLDVFVWDIVKNKEI